MNTAREEDELEDLDTNVTKERSPAREHLLWRVLIFARYSFAFRAVLVMALGTLMSCSGCNTCLAVASWIGCNACSEGSSSGCNFSSCKSDDDDGGETTSETLCADGVDNDNDSDTDCDDYDCIRAGACGEYYCYDERDDDGDGAVDCDDPDCCHYEWCRCQCEARCEEGTTLCIADEDSCDHECCSAGQECVDGRCTACEPECGSGYVPCWTGDELCEHLCCTPGQECGGDGCQCVTECEDGTNPCVVDMWTCEFECCHEGDVCSGGGCTPYSCTAAIEVEAAVYDLEIEWSEFEDTILVSGLDGCLESAGAEILLEVSVPAGEAIMFDRASSGLFGMHVLDECPPRRCRSSLGSAPSSATLWINSSGDEERVLVLLEAGELEESNGQLRVTRFTGEACDAAIEVTYASDGFSWAADARLFGEWTEEPLCGMDPRRQLWFEVDVNAYEQLSVTAWGEGAEQTPTIAVMSGGCGELSCLVAGEAMISLINDLPGLRTLSVVIGCPDEYDGELSVDLLKE